MNEFILPFGSPNTTLAVVGGKGASLSRLAQTGFPVPPGFLVTTAAYKRFVQSNNLQAQIMTLIDDMSQSTEDVSTAIRQRFDQGSTPPEVAVAIEQAYTELTGVNGEAMSLAVRSSATAEDLPGASFAGQQESYLNVQGAEALLQAVKQCWSSLWTARALEYRTRQAIDPASVSLAVVVQVMVSAEAAGIMFTANPISGVRDEIVISAAWGLGEAIVGGVVTPDSIVADKTTGAIKAITVAEKTVMTAPTRDGTEERSVPVAKQRAQVLTAAQVAQLAQLGAAIETHYGAPQDIEWCWAEDRFWIVQSRPITTLPPAPVRWASPIPGAKWMNDILAAEWAKEPLSPLGATTTFATMIAARERMRSWPPAPKHRRPWSTLINGWLYMRADHDLLPTIGVMAGMMLAIGFSSLTGSPNGHCRVQRTWSQRLAILDELEQTDFKTVADVALRRHVDRLLAELAWWWQEFVWFNGAGRTSAQVIGAMKIAGVSDPTVLFRGNDSLLLESARALWRAAADPSQIEAYLARFGHTIESADPIHPTLREAPDLLAWQLAAARQSDAGPDERLARSQRERAAAEAAIGGLRGLRGILVRNILAIGQSHAAHADNAVFQFQRLLAALRAACLEVGRRLVQTNKLTQADEVFYLEEEELWAADTTPTEQLRATVTQRRTQREQHKRLAPPAFVPLLTDPIWANDPVNKLLPPAMHAAMFERGVQERNGRQVLVGAPSSPGRARGIARVLSGPEEFARFQKNDVLVAHATSPLWTPLFGIAAAVVTEVGGQFAHAAIVAREFGIPLVDGALDATRVIRDGMPVVVDGSAGIVEL
ncbi:MAG: hypothetical protein DYG89_45840 [Caldilinea sp. CFX5]|nr:hypothetical protein [Caldilinea sp. CFX5]